MPLKIIGPRNSKTKNLYIRGSYLGIAVDKSCGTDKRSVAQSILKRIEREIELGEYQKEKTVAPNAPTFLSAAIAYRPSGGQGRVFRFHQGGHLKHMLTRAKLAAIGLPCPVRRPIGWRVPDNRLAWVNFHTFRHTWATWMRRYGGLDTKGLVATRNWRDERSASRYAHAVTSEEWDRVERLPAVGNIRGV
jgi:integrase